MPFLSTIEELAEERGQVKGAKETCQNNIIKILSKRFDHVTELMNNSITKIDDMLILENLLLSSISVPSLEEFQKLIDAELQQNQWYHISDFFYYEGVRDKHNKLLKFKNYYFDI